MKKHSKILSAFILTFVFIGIIPKTVLGDGFRLPDQQTNLQKQQQQQSQAQLNIFQPQLQPQIQLQQQQQPQLQPHIQLQQQQQQQPQLPQESVNFGEERGRSSFLSLLGLGQDNDPYLARSNQNCLSGDLSECFKTQALNTFDEIFYRDQYGLSDFARVVRLPETQQRSLQQEPFEYSEEPRNEDTDWDQMVKYALRRAERFIKSTALEVEIPEELTEAGRYQARFIGNDIESELDIIEDKHGGGVLKRKKLKKLILPMLLILKIFKLKMLLFLPFILGIAGLKKILGLAAIILPGLFAYFKLCRPPGASGFGGNGGGVFSGLFGSKTPYPQYSPQGVGASPIYHHHEHYQGGNEHSYQPYHQEPSFAKPYTDYYSKNYQSTATKSVSFGDAHEAAYSGYYGRSTGKDIKSEQKI